MSKIKLTFIDKDRWDTELDLLYLKEDIDYEKSHEFINANNVVDLTLQGDQTTICSNATLNSLINKKITNKHKTAIIINFGLELEYIFSNLIQTVMDKGVDIYVIDKSPFPIRNNVAMTIDLNEYDITTDFESVKHILEKNLNESLENARKSKKPKHANDLGIQLKEESNKKLYEMLTESFGLVPDTIIPIEDDYEMLLNEFEDLEDNDEYLDFMREEELSVKLYKDQKVEFSRYGSKLILDKEMAIKVRDIIGALFNE